MVTTRHNFRVEGMHCGSCALLIDDTLEDPPGVRSTQTTVKDGRSTVELDISQAGPQDVVAAPSLVIIRANGDSSTTASHS